MFSLYEINRNNMHTALASVLTSTGGFFFMFEFHHYKAARHCLQIQLFERFCVILGIYSSVGHLFLR
jgi:hypothetical protein